jgi:catechol 2,3-dioxygenase-like lactoylglutathione lyase family enzyme
MRAMTVPQRISMVTLGVADVARSTAFYESLGWRRSSASQDGAITFFATQGSALGLFRRESLADDAGVAPDGDGFRAVAVALNCDSPAEVDAVVQQWLDGGALLVKAPEKVFWGGYSGYVADPDGHLWEIAHNPSSPNDDDGRMQLPD